MAPEHNAGKTDIIESLSAPQKLEYDRFELVVTSGADTGVKRAFGQEVVQIGTARANDFVLTDRTVSRFHAKIDTQQGEFTISDLDSTNGTYVGMVRVKAAYLSPKATIRFGNTQLTFQPLGDKTTVELPTRENMGGIIGRAPKMRQMYSIIERVSASDLPVIIEGETGTGKDLVARVLHEHSRRVDGPFEVLDCAAIPDTLIESELFGHVKGAFTGAERDRAGIFERADGGTVFLDELGELKLDLQPKLLRVLETGQIRRVGDGVSRKVDVRIVAATHRPLRKMVNKSQFREDLYYRLAGCKIDLPPLRERREDIPLLAARFLQSLEQSGQPVPPALDAETLEMFMSYEWPGNVRQLRNAVERVTIMGSAELVLERAEMPASSAGSSAPLDARDTLLPMKEAKEAFERRYLEGLMSRHEGSVREAALAAELHPKSLARLLRRYAIDRSEG